ncbi:uncharacterized protein VP01_2199g4 [Puccinia sorghi]|uniref:Uncharacterized protein n=1 Tax=Puccinia sorghi TaxID=27349 RepID=A0A0L6V933_9BASI|nr:uncharacterized protein VP01_2199g4 [Puccinia sorghi]
MVQRDGTSSSVGKGGYVGRRAESMAAGNDDGMAAVRQILAHEMSDPECRKANMDILKGFALFFSSIAFFKFAGDLLVPAF